MEQGGIHKHTTFYIVEVLLGLILVGMVVLFYFWMGSLNDQIAALEMERDSLLVQEDNSDDQEIQADPRILQLADGQWVELRPHQYSVQLRGTSASPFTFELSYPLPTVLEEASWFHKTTDERVIGVDHYYWDSVDVNNAAVYINPSAEVGVQLAGDGVTFDKSEYSITTNLVGAECTENLELLSAGETVQERESALDEFLALCDSQNPASVSALLVNGEAVIIFEPVTLTHIAGGLGTPGVLLSPSIDLIWQGVSSDLDKAYFNFLGESYVIDNVGNLSQTELPEDLVTMTDEVYE